MHTEAATRQACVHRGCLHLQERMRPLLKGHCSLLSGASCERERVSRWRLSLLCCLAAPTLLTAIEGALPLLCSQLTASLLLSGCTDSDPGFLLELLPTWQRHVRCLCPLAASVTAGLQDSLTVSTCMVERHNRSMPDHPTR